MVVDHAAYKEEILQQSVFLAFQVKIVITEVIRLPCNLIIVKKLLHFVILTKDELVY